MGIHLGFPWHHFVFTVLWKRDQLCCVKNENRSVSERFVWTVGKMYQHWCRLNVWHWHLILDRSGENQRRFCRCSDSVSKWSNQIAERRHFEVHCFILGYYLNMLTCFNAPQTRFFSYCPLLQRHIPCLSDMLCFSSCLFKAPLMNTQSALIGRLTHARPCSSKNNREAVLNHFLHFKLAARHYSCKCATWCCCVMSGSHRIKGGSSNEAFQEQYFLWERGASVGVDKNGYKTLKEKKKHALWSSRVPKQDLTNSLPRPLFRHQQGCWKKNQVRHYMIIENHLTEITKAIITTLTVL